MCSDCEVKEDDSVYPDKSNIHNKKQFTFLIEYFLGEALKSDECNFNEANYRSLMEFWEKL